MLKIFIVLFTCTFGLFGGLNQKNAFKVFFWTASDVDTVKTGCYGYIQIDSISSSPTQNFYHTSFWLTYDWWFLRFEGAYVPATITCNKEQPSVITMSPDHFLNVEWFSGFKLDNTNDSLQFYFPLLPQTTNYGRYDYFMVDVDSLRELQLYGAGDSIMVGTFIQKKPGDNGGTVLLGRNAFIVELTDSNPFRIKSLRCQGNFDSLLNQYLKFPLDTLKKDAFWYGVDILDTISNIPRIKVSSIIVAGIEPFLTGTKKDVSWKLENKTGVDSCLISVSYDQMTWAPLGKTTIDTLVPWTISIRASEKTVLKVIACGKYGERISAIKNNMHFCSFEIRSLQIK
jgi:hypothetical protein